jgi:3,4-dihydroxy 2-butanone 4-phosphate synthase/GTP cyclohydrolase II
MPIAVRVHVHQPLCDLLEPLAADCGWPLANVLSRLGQMDTGVAVILRPPVDEREVRNQLDAWHGLAPESSVKRDHVRTYGVGAQILKDLGVQRMRVMSAPKRFHALAGYGLEVVDYIYDETADDAVGAN